MSIAHNQCQWEKRPHGLVQARYQEISLMTDIGYSLKTIWPLKIRMIVQLVWLVQSPSWRRNPRWKNKSLAQKQRNADGAQTALSASPKRRKKRTSSSRRSHQMYQSPKLKDLIPWTWTWLRQNSNGKQRWKDWILNITLTVFLTLS